jgi:hypothetical protein
MKTFRFQKIFRFENIFNFLKLVKFQTYGFLENIKNDKNGKLVQTGIKIRTGIMGQPTYGIRSVRLCGVPRNGRF